MFHVEQFLFEYFMLKKIDKKLIKKLLSDSKLNLAIDFILDHFNICESEHKNLDLHNEILVISMQFNDLESKIRVNIIQYDDFLIYKTRLTKSILEILNEIPCNNCDFQLEHGQIKKYKSKIVDYLNLSEKQKKIISEFIRMNFEL